LTAQYATPLVRRATFVSRWFGAPAGVALAVLLAACNSSAVPQGNYGNIAGTITSTSGQPIAGAVVQVDYGPVSNPTGSDGKYTVQGVPVSPATSPAHVAVTTVPPGYQAPPPLDNVIVQVGQTTPNVNFVLSPG
jgi:hypothetical protein